MKKDDLVSLVVRAFTEKELLKIGNRSYINAFKYPETRFDAKDLLFDPKCINCIHYVSGICDVLGTGLSFPPTTEVVCPSYSETAAPPPLPPTLEQYTLVPPSSLIFKWGDGKYYDKRWSGEVYGGLTSAVPVLQGAHDALPAEGGVIQIKNYFSEDAWLYLTKSNVTITTEKAFENGANFNLDINSTGGEIKNLKFSGINFRRAYFKSYVNPINHLVFEFCKFVKTTYQRVQFESDRSANSAIMNIEFHNCWLTDISTNGRTYGMLHFLNLGEGTSQIYFKKCWISHYGDNETTVSVENSARIGLKIDFDDCMLLTGVYTGYEFLRQKGGGTEAYATGIRVRWNGGIIELHGTTNFIILDSDASASKKFFGFWLKDALISLIGMMTLITNNCTNWTGADHPFVFKNNLILTPANFSLGTLGSGLTVKIKGNIGFKTESLLENVTVNTTSTTIPHGLAVTPNSIRLIPRADARVWRSANPDGTNIYLQASAQVVCDIYVSREF